jgi:hypothetical protein
MTIKLSKTSKLDGIMSWSLQALDTCPGMLALGRRPWPCCQGCYATTGNYRFKNVKAPREFNREDWQRGEWVSDMIQALDSSRYFRWFDSGDMYTLELAKKMLQVMEATPWVKHWLPTRMHKFTKFAKVIAAMEALPNAVVRRSSDSISGQVIPGATSSTIISGQDQLPAGATLCRAYEHGGTCNGCRACYDKAATVIAYMAHGKSMAKVIRIMEAA